MRKLPNYNALYAPKTSLGEALIALRQSYIDKEKHLLTEDQIIKESRLRREFLWSKIK